MAKKRYKYACMKKQYSRGGVESSIFALVSGILFLVSALWAFAMHGKGGMFLGAFGILALGISILGLRTGIKSFEEKEKDLLYSKIGSVANGILTAVWIILFFAGIL